MAAQNPNGRRVSKTKRSAEYTILQIRVSSTSSPDLFDFVMSLPEGTASSYGRNVLDQALRAGYLTPSGFALNNDDRMQSLQMQLQIAKEDLIASKEQVQILKQRLSVLETRESASMPAPGPNREAEPSQAGTPTQRTTSQASSAEEAEPLSPTPVATQASGNQPLPAEPSPTIENGAPQHKRTLPTGFANALRSSQVQSG